MITGPVPASQPGAAVRLAMHRQLAAALLRPLLQIAQPAARPTGRYRSRRRTRRSAAQSPASTVDHPRRATVAHRVADRLPDHRERMHTHPGRHQRVDRAPMRTDGPTPDPAAASAAVSSKRRRNPTADASPAVCRSKMAVRMSRMVASRSSTDCRSGARRPVRAPPHRALQLQAAGEQPLNDMIVQIPGDPVTVGEHIQLTLGPVLLPQLQRQRGLVGERGQ